MDLNTDNFIINPVVAWQLGLTEDGDVLAIVNTKAEDGREVSLVFPSPFYLREVAGMLANAADMLADADENGWLSASERVNSMADDDIPDDISGLLGGEGE